MTWVPSKRGTLLVPSGTHHNPDLKHLFIICAIKSDGEELFLVSVSKWRNDLCDATCVLEPGEHPFIIIKSYVLYRKTRIEPSSAIIKGVEAGNLIPREPFDDSPFARVCTGVLESPQTSWKHKRIYRAWVEA